MSTTYADGALLGGAADEPSPEEAEFFPTPAWVTDRIIERIAPDLRRLALLQPGAVWLDPCVGNGALPDAVDVQVEGLRWVTWDIRDTGRADHVGDWIRQPAANNQRTDVCIMNPPFSLALQFAEKGLRSARVVIMLQRLGWLASDTRRKWLHAHRPAVFVLPNRPDFDGRGGDSHDYAWYVWGLGHCEVDVLRVTPKEVRKAQKPKNRPAAPQLDLFGMEGAA